MKSYRDLSKDQQTKACEFFFCIWLQNVAANTIRFGGSAEMDTLQEQIEKACLRAEAAQTPWFAHEYLQDDDVIVHNLRKLATADALEAFYMESGERCVDLSEVNKIELDSKTKKGM